MTLQLSKEQMIDLTEQNAVKIIPALPNNMQW